MDVTGLESTDLKTTGPLGKSVLSHGITETQISMSSCSAHRPSGAWCFPGTFATQSRGEDGADLDDFSHNILLMKSWASFHCAEPFRGSRGPPWTVGLHQDDDWCVLRASCRKSWCHFPSECTLTQLHTIIFFSTRVGTQSLMLARGAIYLEPHPKPFFSDRVSH
jgi:hypothetical protein